MSAAKAFANYCEALRMACPECGVEPMEIHLHKIPTGPPTMKCTACGHLQYMSGDD